MCGRISLAVFLLLSSLSASIRVNWIVNYLLSLVIVVIVTPIVCLAIHHLGFGLVGIGSYKLPEFNFPFTFFGFVLAFALASFRFVSSF